MNNHGLADPSIHALIKWHENVVRDVLDHYMQDHECPCNWPQFEYWASKEQGPGWQDSIQNDLVDAARQLNCFSMMNPIQKRYAVEARLRCEKCGREWLSLCEEWRMLAYHKQLVPVNPSETITTFERLADHSFFATAGRGPQDSRLLTIVEWAEFMLGEHYDLPPMPAVKTEQVFKADQRPKRTDMGGYYILAILLGLLLFRVVSDLRKSEFSSYFSPSPMKPSP